MNILTAIPLLYFKITSSYNLLTRTYIKKYMRVLKIERDISTNYYSELIKLIHKLSESNVSNFIVISNSYTYIWDYIQRTLKSLVCWRWLYVTYDQELDKTIILKSELVMGHTL